MISFLKRKNSFMILFNILIFLISTTLIYNNLIKNYWEKNLSSSIDYRTVLVSYNNDLISKNEAIQELLSFKEVNSVHEYSELQIPMKINNITQKENSFYLMGSDKSPIKLSTGSELIEEDRTIICPQYFYPYETNNTWNYNYKNAIDLSNYLNKYISLSFLDSDETENYKLVGLYDPSISNTYGIICYTSWENVQKLNLKYQNEFFKETTESYFPLVVVLKNAKEVPSFEQKLSQEKLVSQGAIQKINKTNGNSMLYILILLSFISLFVLIIYSIIFFKRKQKIKGNIILNIIIQNFLATACCIIFSFPVLSFINIFIKDNINNNLSLKINYWYFFLMFIIPTLLFTLYVIFYCHKKGGSYEKEK